MISRGKKDYFERIESEKYCSGQKKSNNNELINRKKIRL